MRKGLCKAIKVDNVETFKEMSCQNYHQHTSSQILFYESESYLTGNSRKKKKKAKYVKAKAKSWITLPSEMIIAPAKISKKQFSRF